MRFIVNYIKSCFCEHEWELIFNVEVKGGYCDEIWHTKTYRCKKCGYAKKYDSH